MYPRRRGDEWSPVFINEESAKPPPRAPNRRSFGAYFPPRQTPRAPSRSPSSPRRFSRPHIARARARHLSRRSRWVEMTRTTIDPASRRRRRRSTCSTTAAGPTPARPSSRARLPSVTFRRRRGGEFRSSVRCAESPRASRRRRGVGRRARERSPATRLDVESRVWSAWTTRASPDSRGAAPSAASTSTPRRTSATSRSPPSRRTTQTSARSACTGTSASPTPPSCISRRVPSARARQPQRVQAPHRRLRARRRRSEPHPPRPHSMRLHGRRAERHPAQSRSLRQPHPPHPVRGAGLHRSIPRVRLRASKTRVLDLCGSQTLTDRALVEIAEGCPNLRRLNVSWCTKLTDEGLIAVARMPAIGVAQRSTGTCESRAPSRALADPTGVRFERWTCAGAWVSRRPANGYGRCFQPWSSSCFTRESRGVLHAEVPGSDYWYPTI